MKDFVLQVGNLGAGKTVEMMAMALYSAEATAVDIAELRFKVDSKQMTTDQMNEAVKHLRQSYLNFPSKIALLRADCEAQARVQEASQGTFEFDDKVLSAKYRAMATRDIPNHIFYIGSPQNLPQLPEYGGVQSVSNNVYSFIAKRRVEVEKNPLPDGDEGKDFMGIDEAQDLLRSRRSGDKYVKVLSENADFFRKMGLEVQYQGPQQSQMDKNFRGKSTKKILAEKFEYRDPATGLYEDPKSKQNFYYNKYTVFDTSNTEKRKSATFYIPFEDPRFPVTLADGEVVGQGAKLIHRYYGTNVFHSQSLTTKSTLQEFLTDNPEAALPDQDEEIELEQTGAANELIIETARQVTIMSQALAKNPLFTMKPRDVNALLKGLGELSRNPFLNLRPKEAEKLLKKLMGL